MSAPDTAASNRSDCRKKRVEELSASVGKCTLPVPHVALN
jgi:hypothetical protein